MKGSLKGSLIGLTAGTSLVALIAATGVVNTHLIPAIKGAAGVKESAAITESAAMKAYNRLPLTFEPNRGQAGSGFGFVSRGDGYTMFLSPTRAVMKLAPPAGAALQESGAPSSRAVEMVFEGANPRAAGSGQSALGARINYLKGDSRLSGIPAYGKVKYRDVYPGVDLAFYGKQGKLEYDFVVAPGADPKRIKMAVNGAEGLSLKRNGDLSIKIGENELIQRKPHLYQQTASGRKAVRGSFTLDGNRVGFRVGPYDKSRTLVIDPVITYGSYLGGGGADVGFGVAVDRNGNAYLAGTAPSTNFPTKGGVTCGGASSTVTASLQCDQPEGDAFVTKLNTTTTGPASLVWSTYLGGDKNDVAWDVAVDSGDNVYVAGSTESGENDLGTPFEEKPFPTTSNAFDETCGTDGLCNAPAPDLHPDCHPVGPKPCPRTGFTDAFLAKLNPAGSALLYSSYLGGSDHDQDLNPAAAAWGHMDIAVQGEVAYLAASTGSSDFPATPNGDRTCGTAGCNGNLDAFLSVFDTTQSGLSSLAFSTYIGGDGDDEAKGVDVDAAGDAYVGGMTSGFNANPLDPASPLINNFPVANALQPDYRGGTSDGFVTKAATGALLAEVKVNGKVTAEVAGTGVKANPNNGTVSTSTGPAWLAYSTYLGGGGIDEVWDVAVQSVFKDNGKPAGGRVYATGYTDSGDDLTTPAPDGPVPYFPTTANAYDTSYNGRATAADGSTIFLNGDAFVSELAVKGDALHYSTFLGGGDLDIGMGIDLDSAGQAYLTGYTTCEAPVEHLGPTISTIQVGLPTGLTRTGVPTDATYPVLVRATGSNPAAADAQDLPPGHQVALTAQPDPISGTSVHFSNGANTITVAVNANGNVTDSVTPSTGEPGVARIRAEILETTTTATGRTFSSGDFATAIAEWGYPFPSCQGSFPIAVPASAPQPAMDGSYLGHELHNSPTDGWVAKLNASGGDLVYSTYLGGNDFDRGYAIAVRDRDASGAPVGPEAYITGRTGSDNMPGMNGAYESKILIKNPAGQFVTSKGNRDAYLTKITEP